MPTKEEYFKELIYSRSVPFCLPLCPLGCKKEHKKGTPLSRSFGLPCVSHCCWDVKKLGFASNSFNVCFQQQFRCSAGQNGVQTTNVIAFKGHFTSPNNRVENRKTLRRSIPSAGHKSRAVPQSTGASERLPFLLAKKEKGHIFQIYQVAFKLSVPPPCSGVIPQQPQPEGVLRH